MSSRKQKLRKPRDNKEKQITTILPAEGFARERTVLAVFGTSRSTLWRWIKAGMFPRPCKIGPGTTGWDVAQLREHISKIRNGGVV